MKTFRKWVLPGLLVLALDRGTKIFCIDIYQTVIPGVLALYTTQNTGMAMGLFQDHPYLILAASVAIVALCAWCLRNTRPRGLASVSLSMMAGGALSNMFDRLAYGYVIDLFKLLFMDFYIFNAADVGVVAGAVLFGISALFRPRDWSGR